MDNFSVVGSTGLKKLFADTECLTGPLVQKNLFSCNDKYIYI